MLALCLSVPGCLCTLELPPLLDVLAIELFEAF